MTDDELVSAYVSEHPSALPANNPPLRAAVNTPHYEDRGMWGPYGGKKGTISKPWLDEARRMDAGAASEIGLMTFVYPPGEEDKPV